MAVKTGPLVHRASIGTLKAAKQGGFNLFWLGIYLGMFGMIGLLSIEGFSKHGKIKELAPASICHLYFGGNLFYFATLAAWASEFFSSSTIRPPPVGGIWHY
ncbi:MAG: hypothetical protein U0M15_03675 [Bacillota bacterium]|nr:hypothetical protein [Bacillota bacterium]